MRYKFLGIVFMLGLIFTASYSQDSLNITTVTDIYSYWLSNNSEVDIQGDLVYVETGNSGLKIVDISDIQNPEEIGHYDPYSNLEGFDIEGDYAYLAISFDGMDIVDISDPQRPIRISEFVLEPQDGNFTDLVKYDHYIIAVDNLYGLLVVIDVVDVYNPELISVCEVSLPVLELTIVEGNAYLQVGPHGIQVVDISDLNNPRVVTTFNEDAFDNSEDIIVEEGYAYVSKLYTGLQIFDISDLENIQLVSVTPNEAYPRGLEKHGNLVYLANYHEGVKIYDVSDPTSPFEVGSIESPGIAFAVQYHDDKIFLSDGASGLGIIDVSNPEEPEYISEFDVRGSIKYTHKDGDKYYFADFVGIRIVDMSDPVNPVELGSFETDGTAIDVTVEGDYAYVADLENGLVVLDVSDPGNIMQIGHNGEGYNGRGISANYICSEGSTVCVSALNGGVRVYDVSDPSNPIWTGTRHEDGVLTVELHQGYCHYANTDDIVGIIDVNDPENPQFVGYYEFPIPNVANITNIRLDNLYSYICAVTDLFIFDISDINNPSLVFRDTPENKVVKDFQPFGTHAYYLTYSMGMEVDNPGLQVVDISDLINPELLGYMECPSHGEDVAIYDEYVVVNTGYYLYIYDCSEALNSEVLTIPLNDRYFELISTPLQPSNPAVDFLFRSVESLQIAYQSDGLFLIPDLGINLIGDIDPTQAYRVFCDEEETVSIVGDSLPFDTEYSLHADQWNWIGHPFQSDVDVTVACESITENIIIMLTDDGRLWIPGEPINTIGDMQPGEGYFGFVTEDVTFQYDPPGFGNYRGVIRPEIASNSPAAEFSASTGLPCAILVQLSDDLHHLNPARIEVYDGDLLVGAATVPDDKTTIPVIAWQGDEEHGLEGFTNGNAIQVKVLDASGEIIAENSNNDAIYGKGPYAEITVSAIENESELPLEFSIGKAYPNPFNPLITVPYTLPEKMEVRLSLYNIVGQQVAELNQGVLDRGHHEVVWEAVNQTSGVYFLVLDAGEHHAMQKVILLR